MVGPFVGQHPVPVVQAHIGVQGRIGRGGGISRHGEPGPVSGPQEDGGAGHIVQDAVLEDDIGQGGAVHGLHAEASGPLEPHPPDRHQMVAAGGLRAELQPSGGAAAVHGNQLVPCVLPGVYAARVVAAYGAVLYEHVLEGLEDARPEGGLQAQALVGEGVADGVPHRHVPAAVDVEGVPNGVHQDVVHV